MVTAFGGFSHIVLLCVGHRTGFKPAVKHFGGAVVGLAVFDDHDLVHEVLVQVGHLHAGERLELCD